MASSSSSKGGKSGALDAFWDTLGGASSSSPDQMSDLFKSLSKRGPEHSRDLPPPDAEKAKDMVVTLVHELLAAGQDGWTVAEIAQRGRIAPNVALTAIQDAIAFGLVAENNQNPERKRFRLTGAGQDLAHTP